jgi:hypothetical protein
LPRHRWRNNTPQRNGSNEERKSNAAQMTRTHFFGRDFITPDSSSRNDYHL